MSRDSHMLRPGDWCPHCKLMPVERVRRMPPTARALMCAHCGLVWPADEHYLAHPDEGRAAGGVGRH